MTQCEFVNSSGERCSADSSLDCYLPDDGPNDIIEQLCTEHAIQSGYCCMCGTFWAGIDSYEFSRIKGVCENCISEFDDEWEYDEDDALYLEPYYDDDQYANDALDWKAEEE